MYEVTCPKINHRHLSREGEGYVIGEWNLNNGLNNLDLPTNNSILFLLIHFLYIGFVCPYFP